jgi:hypothetical protein
MGNQPCKCLKTCQCSKKYKTYKYEHKSRLLQRLELADRSNCAKSRIEVPARKTLAGWNERATTIVVDDQQQFEVRTKRGPQLGGSSDDFVHQKSLAC